MQELTDKEFANIRDLVYRYAGINLTEQKRTLVMGRLRKVLVALGFDNYSDYFAHVEADKSGKALEEMINRISTNHTYFFREKAHFEFLLSTGLPEVTQAIKASGKNDLRLWCAAAATGEEPYCLAMLLLEYFGAEYRNWSAGLLATDISTHALSHAMRGVYNTERVAPTPAPYKGKYLKQTGEDAWEVSPVLKKEVLYRRFNLMAERWPFKGKFHIIFCRNVMIYFDQPTRERLVRKFYEHTAPGGYLFIGHSESLGREQCPYQYVKPAVYRKA